MLMLPSSMPFVRHEMTTFLSFRLGWTLILPCRTLRRRMFSLEDWFVLSHHVGRKHAQCAMAAVIHVRATCTRIGPHLWTVLLYSSTLHAVQNSSGRLRLLLFRGRRLGFTVTLSSSSVLKCSSVVPKNRSWYSKLLSYAEVLVLL